MRLLAQRSLPPRSVLALVASLALRLPVAQAQERELPVAPAAVVEVELEVPASSVQVGDHLEVIAHVRMRSGARGPWMLAPTSDGPALEVVRGRLLSIDADAFDPDTGEASLRIPVVARAAGMTVLRARVTAYGCEDGRCRAIAGEGSVVVEVLAR